MRSQIDYDKTLQSKLKASERKQVEGNQLKEQVTKEIEALCEWIRTRNCHFERFKIDKPELATEVDKVVAGLGCTMAHLSSRFVPVEGIRSRV